MAIGRKTGGRLKGGLNKRTLDVTEKLARLKCDTIQGMATIAMNNLPCGTCRGEGKTRYKLPNPVNCGDCFALSGKPKRDCKTCAGTGMKTWGVRICESCWGNLYEICSPELRGKMYAELTQYEHPKRKAVEHSGPEGGAIHHRHEIVFVE